MKVFKIFFSFSVIPVFNRIGTIVRLMELEAVSVFPTILYFCQVFIWVWLKLIVSALSRRWSREAAPQKWVWSEKLTSRSKSNNFTHSLFSDTAASIGTKRALPGSPPGVISLLKHLDPLSIWSEISTLLFIDSLQLLRAFAKCIFNTEIKPKTCARRKWNYSEYRRKNDSDMWCSVGDHEMKV